MTNTKINTADKQLILAMTFEFVILVIKLASRLENLDELSEKEMDCVQENVCNLQSLIGEIIEVDKEDIRRGALIASKNNNINGLKHYLYEMGAES